MDAVDNTMQAWSRVFEAIDLQPLEIALRIHRLNLLAAMQVDVLLRPFKIGAGDSDVIARLFESGPSYELTPRQLATGCFVTTGAMTGRIDRLERACLVKRVKSPGDRRSFNVKLTQKGVDLAQSICAKVLKTAFSEMVRALTAADKMNLLSILRRMESRLLE